MDFPTSPYIPSISPPRKKSSNHSSNNQVAPEQGITYRHEVPEDALSLSDAEFRESDNNIFSSDDKLDNLEELWKFFLMHLKTPKLQVYI